VRRATDVHVRERSRSARPQRRVRQRGQVMIVSRAVNSATRWRV